MHEEAEILRRLVDLTEAEDTTDQRTFFEIINRHTDEDLISRMLAYTLKKDDGSRSQRLSCENGSAFFGI